MNNNGSIGRVPPNLMMKAIATHVQKKILDKINNTFDFTYELPFYDITLEEKKNFFI